TSGQIVCATFADNAPSPQRTESGRLKARDFRSHNWDINQTDGKVWLKSVRGVSPPFVPLSTRKTAIISLANLKGGVGKTTLTANIGAAFASEGLRVLLIDLDHQSTLSTRTLANDEREEVNRTKRFIHSVFTETADLTTLNRCVTRLRHHTGD